MERIFEKIIEAREGKRLVLRNGEYVVTEPGGNAKYFRSLEEARKEYEKDSYGSLMRRQEGNDTKLVVSAISHGRGAEEIASLLGRRRFLKILAGIILGRSRLPFELQHWARDYTTEKITVSLKNAQIVTIWEDAQKQGLF